MVGETTIEFDREKTKILANDGLNTNVLRKVNDGYYTIINNEGIYNEQDYLLIYSHTHPNQYTWYSNNNIHLSWLTQNTKYNKFVYKLDQNAFTSPMGGRIITDTSINLRTYEDGIYYFHLGRITDKNEMDLINHFRIKIDTSPPSLLIVNYSSNQINKGEIVRFEIDGRDESSGIAYQPYSNYLRGFIPQSYIKINDQPFFPVNSPVYIPFFKGGNNYVTIRMFDEAGNHKDYTVNIYVNE